MPLTFACLIGIGALMKDWKHALLLGTLPGFWLIATHPSTVDAPSMLLALAASLLFPTQPYAACFVACLSGWIHERGPVFAALYAWHPLLLVGLVAVGWWRRPAAADADLLVGRGFMRSIVDHRPYNDWLDMRVHWSSLRGIWLGMAWFGCSLQGLATLAVAIGSRVIGTDSCRYVFWAAPLLVRELPDAIPLWAIGAHVLTFKRAI
jgi:hypothetical protein